MTRAALGLLLVAAASSTASAGTYLGLGIGTGADMSADHGVMVKGNDRTARAFVGYRFGRFSLEAAASRYGMFLEGVPFTATQAAVLAKYSFPLGYGFELFGRGGIQHTWLSSNFQGYDNAEGTGIVLGAGVEYRFRLSFVPGASIFVDYERAQTPTVTNTGGATWAGGAGMFTAGLSVSL